MDALIALLPIVVVLGLMLFARWPAVRAGAAALLLAVVVVLAVFPFETIDSGVAGGLLGSFAEAVFTSATILWIILPALAIYNLQNETDAVEAIRSGLTELARDPRLTALVVAWFFSLLLEEAARVRQRPPTPCSPIYRSGRPPRSGTRSTSPSGHRASAPRSATPSRRTTSLPRQPSSGSAGASRTSCAGLCRSRSR